MRTNRTPEQIRAFEQAIKQGKSIYEARLAAGYSKSAARSGKHGLPVELVAIVAERLKPYERLGRRVTADEQEAIVRGAALMNVAEGKDSAVNSIKLLGSDRRVNMWTPEVQMGIVVLQMPESLRRADVDAPCLEAEEVKSLPEKT